MTETPITDIVRQAARTAVAVRTSQGKDLAPMAHLVMPNGGVRIALLDVIGDGRDFALAARLLLLQMQPQHAVVLIEGWTTRKDLPRDDPDARAVRAGALRPSQLPPHKRGEMLTAVGESTDGERAWALYYLEPDGSFSEMMTSWQELAAGDQGLETHFYPLFVDHDVVRHMPSETVAVMEELLGSRAKVLHLANRAARQFFASGLAGDPRAFTEHMDALMTKARTDMGWRGR